MNRPYRASRPRSHQGADVHGAEPWLARPDWASGRIRCSWRKGMIGGWVFAGFWNLVTAPTMFFLPEEVLEKGNNLALLGLVFPLVGVGLLIAAARTMLRRRKYGTSVLEMTRVPGVVGGRLEGRIQTGLRHGTAAAVRLSLTCVNRIRRGTGSNRSTQERILWQEESGAAPGSLGAGPSGATIPISFVIPFDCRATDHTQHGDTIHWLLGARADLPGVDFDARFEVPIFRTAQSSPDAPAGAAVERGAAAGPIIEPARRRPRAPSRFDP
jgi:hypothetical protein